MKRLLHTDYKRKSTLFSMVVKQGLSKPGRHLPFQCHFLLLPHHQVSPPMPFSSVLHLPPPLLGMSYPLCPLCPPSNLWSSLSKPYSSFEAQLKAPLVPTIMEPTLSNEYRLARFLGRWSELGEEECSSHSQPSFPGCS